MFLKGAELSTDHHELDQVAREDAKQTWHTQTYSEGELGTHGRGPGSGGLQQHSDGGIESEWMSCTTIAEAAARSCGRKVVGARHGSNSRREASS